MTRIIAVVVVIILLCNVGFLSQLNSSGFNNDDKNTSESFNTLHSPLPALSLHGVIRIESNTEFITQAGMEGWNGTGQPGDPYIIENYEINAQAKGTGILIANITSVFFIIRNCTIYGASGNVLKWDYGAGITLVNVQNPSMSLAILENNTCFDNKIGIYTYAININIVKNNNCSNNKLMGIYIDYSDFNKFINNTCGFNNHSGIFINQSTYNTLKNNTCSSNNVDGIYGNKSVGNNDIKNNLCFNNSDNGISLTSSSTNNVISNNICFFNGHHGLSITGYSSQNIISGNICDLNNRSGIIINQSDNSIVDKNIITNHSNGSGIEIELSALCEVDNNICTFNQNGIFLSEADTNTLNNNSCLNNTNAILLLGSDNNQIMNNTLKFNIENGIKFINASAYNYIRFNEIANNTNGINLTQPGLASVLNFFSNNNIAYSTYYGIYIDNGDNNHFFHNNILFNPYPVKDYTYKTLNSNQYSLDNEGNYWSDYTGLDNGNDSRPMGDGIGDTEIPHLGVDNYPFITPWGWRSVPTPILLDPGEFTLNGTYNVTWNSTLRANGYILYEDTNWSFASPVEVYNGSGLSIKMENKDNATYYYMLRAYNDYGISNWSEKVEIIVDWRPSSPTGLVAFQPTGHTISLYWNANPELDILGYRIYINQSDFPPSAWTQLAEVSNTTTNYIVQNLNEETTYYFSLSVFDKYSDSFNYIDYTFATTKDVTAPAPPKNLTAMAISDTEINLNWNASTEPDLAGYLVFMAEGAPNATFYLRYKIDSLNTSYLVTDLHEEFTYYFKLKAFDDVPNNSTEFSELAWATTMDLTAPTKPVGLEVKNPTYNSLTITWLANPEADVVGYLLKRTNSLVEDINLTKDPITGTQYIDTGLNESTTYYYRLIAIDDAGLVSQYTDYVSGTTLTIPKPPVINLARPDFNLTEDVVDDTSIKLLTWFTDPNDDKLNFHVDGDLHINVTINQNTGKVVLTPEQNWNGFETLIFYASDGATEISDSVKITVVGVNDDPGPVEILWPNDEYEIKEGEALDFRGQCADPDLPYGDQLTYKWFSSEDNVLGEGQNLTDIKLSAGYHIITLEVTDSKGSNSYGSINVKVLKKSDDTEPGLFGGLMFVILLIIIIIIIIIVLAVVLSMKKRRRIERAEEEVGEEILETLQPEGDIAGLKLPPEAAGVDEPDEDEAPEEVVESEDEEKDEVVDEIDQEIEEEMAELEVEVPITEEEPALDEDSEPESEDDDDSDEELEGEEEPYEEQMDLGSPMMSPPPDAQPEDLEPPEDLVELEEELGKEPEQELQDEKTLVDDEE